MVQESNEKTAQKNHIFCSLRSLLYSVSFLFSIHSYIILTANGMNEERNSGYISNWLFSHFTSLASASTAAFLLKTKKALNYKAKVSPLYAFQPMPTGQNQATLALALVVYSAMVNYFCFTDLLYCGSGCRTAAIVLPLMRPLLLRPISYSLVADF